MNHGFMLDVFASFEHFSGSGGTDIDSAAAAAAASHAGQAGHLHVYDTLSSPFYDEKMLAKSKPVEEVHAFSHVITPLDGTASAPALRRRLRPALRRRRAAPRHTPLVA